MKRTWVLVIAATVSVALSGCGGDEEPGADATVTVPPPIALDDAAATCTPPVQDLLDEKSLTADPLPAEVVMQVGDDGNTVSISNPESEIPYLEQATVIAMTCMLEETKAPDSVVGEVSQATAMTGRQDAEWDGVQLSYGYAGGTGVSAVFTAS